MSNMQPPDHRGGDSSRPRGRWQHLVITDIDNTLFDFGLYVEAGLQAVLDEGSSLLGLSSDQIAAELRTAFRLCHSVEVPYAYEMLRTIRELPEAQRLESSRRLAAAFWRGAAGRLKPYPDVQSTIADLCGNDVAIVAVTNAPMWETWRKLRTLGLLQYMAGVVAVGSLNRRREPLLKPGDIPEYAQPFHSQMRFYRLLRLTERKPSTVPYQYVLDKIGLAANRVTVVGDSPTKDLAPARSLGLDAVWASYGERQRHLERVLQSVTPFEPPEAVRSQRDAARSYPKLDSFRELEDYIRLERWQLRLPFSLRDTNERTR